VISEHVLLPHAELELEHHVNFDICLNQKYLLKAVALTQLISAKLQSLVRLMSPFFDKQDDRILNPNRRNMFVFFALKLSSFF
jgi:hypothetical protein